jgi:hypothetical protein
MMAILRVMSKLDAGENIELRAALDTPGPGEDILSVTDHWLSTLARLEEDAHELVTLIETNIARQKSAQQGLFDKD